MPAIVLRTRNRCGGRLPRRPDRGRAADGSLNGAGREVLLRQGGTRWGSGFEGMTRARRLDAVAKARAFASWLMVTGQLRVDADVLGRLDLRLGGVAANYCPDAHSWFVEACEQIATRPADVSIQWNALVKITAITGTPPDHVNCAIGGHATS
jgi:hypothetical protein